MSVLCDSTHSVAMSASQTKLPARLKKKEKAKEHSFHYTLCACVYNLSVSFNPQLLILAFHVDALIFLP
jgi:hypothetical protein